MLADKQSARGGAILSMRAKQIEASLAEEASGSTFETADSVPPSPSHFTLSWLTSALANGVAGAKVLDFKLGEAHSGSANRQAARIIWNEAGTNASLPSHVFCKYSDDKEIRLWLGVSKILKQEILFYQEIGPELSIETPDVYHACWHPRAWRSMILLEDIAKSRGATFCTPREVVSRTEMESVLNQLAMLHGRYWRRLGAQARWLRTPHNVISRFSECFDYLALVRTGLERARSVLPDPVMRKAHLLWSGYDASLAAASTGPLTLIHGDPHIGNLYRTGEGEMGILDWQMVMKGRWSHDFAYAMITSLRPEDRRAWERDLLGFYLERLNNSGGGSLTIENAWMEYRQQSLHALLGWLATIGAGSEQPSMQADETSLGVLERAGAAFIDLDPLAALE